MKNKLKELLEKTKVKTKELGKKAIAFADKHKEHKGAFFLYGLVLGYLLGLF